MKNRIYIYAILLMTIAATMAPKAMCQTELYKQYKHLTDVKVVCIMKFPINDTTTTSLTLFVPKTKDAVYYLVEEFNLGLDKEKVYNRFGQEKKYTLYTRNVCKDDIKKRFGEIKSADDYENVAILAYNYNTGTILVFHNIETEERDNVINSFLFAVLKQPKLFENVGINNITK